MAGVTFQAFYEDEPCRKCGSTDRATVQYEQADEMWAVMYERERWPMEWLSVTCPRCRYVRKCATKDAKAA